MTMIYYVGQNLDYAPATGVMDPVVIRGYDRAGHALTAIRYGLTPAQSYIDPNFTYQTRYAATVPVYDRAGVSLGSVFTINNAPRQFPQRCVADAVGHLYVASGWITSNIYNTAGSLGMGYADFFRKYRRNGDRIPFPELHGGAIEALALAADGSIFVGGVPVGLSGYFLRKYDSSGTLIWSAASDATPTLAYNTVRDIQLDGDDPIILSEWSSLPNTGSTRRLAKYNGTTGALIWRRWLTSTANQNGMVLYDGVVSVVTGAKYYYVDGWVTYPPTIETADTADMVAYGRLDGYPLTYWITKWDASDGSYLGGIGQATEDSLISGAYYLSFCPVNEQFILSVYKYSPPPGIVNDFYHLTYDATLTFVSEVLIDNYVPTGIRIDSEGTRFLIEPRRYVMLGSLASVPYTTTYGYYHLPVFDVDGVQQWAALNATGMDGVWYTGETWPDIGYFGWVISGTTYYGTALDLHTAYGNIPDHARIGDGGVPINGWQISDVALIENTETWALAFPLAGAVPSWLGDTYIVPPGLALGLRLPAPTWTREYLAQFQPPTIYRAALLADGQSALSLPLASFQCRRTNAGQTLLFVVSHAATTETLSAIQLRLTGDLVIYRGLRFASGLEQIDELLRVALTSVRYDAGSSSASLSLSGSAETATAAAQTRLLRGISYRNQSASGRRVRCDVDTWIRPGDWADLGAGEFMQVDEIVYSVSVSQAVMEITEAA